MNDSKQTFTRYLLGELSEGERSALEERYFADPRVFDEITAAETALVDDYVRDRLPVDVRRRFERAYLTDARRRNRVSFAATLAAGLDRFGAPPSGHDLRPAPAQEPEPGPGWWSGFGMLWPSKSTLGFAVATLLVVSTGIWLAIESRQARQESGQVDGGRDAQERRTPEADATEQARATEADRPSPGPADQPPPQSQPGPAGLSPSFATLILTVGGGERGQDGGRPPTLAIPPGTSDVRLQLRLREHEHASYQVVLQVIGGPQILRRTNLRPVADGAGPVLTVVVPASRLSAGDYLLTLQGAAGGGELDDLSQSLFRVEK